MSDDVNSLKNVVAVCRICHKKFDTPRTIDEYRTWVRMKKKLLQENEIKDNYALFNIEDGYNVALNEPYDYAINATYKHPMTENRIEEIAEESKATITNIKHIDCLLLGVQNTYKSGECDWGSRIIVSEDNFNTLSGAAISVPKGSYTVYYDSSMEYKLNAFSADTSLFYNPTTEQEFTLTQNEPICCDGLFNTRSVFSSFLILNGEDYRTIAATLSDDYKAVSYMVNHAGFRRYLYR